MYFINSKSYNNLTYSIDMLRLKTYIDYDVYSNLDFYIRTYYGDKIAKYWITDRIMQFKYNYTIEIEEGRSFYIGFHHNTENKETHDGLYNLTIEFNPNKIKDNVILRHILNLSGNWYIKSYDLAVDINVNILDLIIDKGHKHKVQMISQGKDNVTYTVGTKNRDMYFKIYNKKIESRLDIPQELTRIEISRILDDFPITDIKILKYGLDYFPEIYINNYIYSFSDYQDKTMLPIIYAVQNGYPINDLSRRYKEKLKQLFEGGQKIKFTDKEATEVLRKTIFAYFIKNEKVRWK